ncbi:MAG: serine hydrolase [Proteobacteria bacterium]|nr:serine hydrolase [Pseudomonadota bacterium]
MTDTFKDMPLTRQCEAAFRPVEIAFRELWNEIEVGAAVCVYHNGRRVVDLAGGWMDREMARPFLPDTLVNVYSTTKGLVTLAIACLTDAKKLALESPVCEYWPEFGAQAKWDITVAELLSHQAGLYQFDHALQVKDLYHWQARVFDLAAQKPAWQPGSQSGYHPVTWGFLAGELIRRVSGMSPGTYIRQQLGEPFGLDLFLGVPAELHDRCADMIGANHARKPVTRPGPERVISLPASNDPAIAPYRHASSRHWREAEIPASNGHASARGLARIFDAAINLEMFSENTLTAMTAVRSRGNPDPVLGQYLTRSAGFILNSPDCYYGPSETAFGHSGAGGSMAFADPEKRVAFGFVMNQMHPDGNGRTRRLIDTLYQCLS